MPGSFIKFYLSERQTHRGVLLWEWLLEKANELGVQGGCAFRPIGGFGRHHVVHEARFFELAGNSGVALEFIAHDDAIERLLATVAEEKIRIVYCRMAASFGVVNPDPDDLLGGAADP